MFMSHAVQVHVLLVAFFGEGGRGGLNALLLGRASFTPLGDFSKILLCDINTQK